MKGFGTRVVSTGVAGRLERNLNQHQTQKYLQDLRDRPSRLTWEDRRLDIRTSTQRPRGGWDCEFPDNNMDGGYLEDQVDLDSDQHSIIGSFLRYSRPFQRVKNQEKLASNWLIAEERAARLRLGEALTCGCSSTESVLVTHISLTGMHLLDHMCTYGC